MASISKPNDVSLGEHSRSIFDLRLKARYEYLSPSEQKVARYIDRNRLAVLSTSAADIGVAIDASDATVIRAVKALGFQGLADLRQYLTASLEPGSNLVDRMRGTTADARKEKRRVIASVVTGHMEALREAATPEAQAVLIRAIDVLDGVHRIVIFGIGPSAALADYVALLLARHGRRSHAFNGTGATLADQLLDLQRDDGLLVLAYGRSHTEVAVVFAEAKRLRTPIVLVTDALEPKLSRQADVIVAARRGRQQRVALHGVTLIVLEAIVMGLAVARSNDALHSLARFSALRSQLA